VRCCIVHYANGTVVNGRCVVPPGSSPPFGQCIR
jgi:hypothetical protein